MYTYMNMYKMYIYIYIYIYVSIYRKREREIYLHMYIIYTSVCIHTYACVHVCMYVCRMYVCMYVCVYVCMYVCMYVRACVCVCRCVPAVHPTCTGLLGIVPTSTHTHISRVHVACMQYVSVGIDACKFECMHGCVCVQARMHVCTHEPS